MGPGLFCSAVTWISIINTLGGPLLHIYLLMNCSQGGHLISFSRQAPCQLKRCYCGWVPIYVCNWVAGWLAIYPYFYVSSSPPDLVSTVESLRCKTSTPTWTSKLKLLYLFLQRTENFRFLMDQRKFSCKILEPV